MCRISRWRPSHVGRVLGRVAGASKSSRNSLVGPRRARPRRASRMITGTNAVSGASLAPLYLRSCRRTSWSLVVGDRQPVGGFRLRCHALGPKPPGWPLGRGRRLSVSPLDHAQDRQCAAVDHSFLAPWFEDVCPVGVLPLDWAVWLALSPWPDVNFVVSPEALEALPCRCSAGTAPGTMSLFGGLPPPLKSGPQRWPKQRGGGKSVMFPSWGWFSSFCVLC